MEHSLQENRNSVNLGIGQLAQQRFDAERQAKLFAQSNKISSDALYAQQRPWVGLDFPSGGLKISPLRVNNEKTEIFSSYTAYTKNFGNYPAQNTETTGELIFVAERGPRKTAIDGAQDYACTGTIGLVAQGAGDMIFPTMSQPARLVADTGATIPPMNGQAFNLFFVGCINYTDQFDHPYHTAFAYTFINSKDGQAARFTDSDLPVIGTWERRSEGVWKPQKKK